MIFHLCIEAGVWGTVEFLYRPVLIKVSVLAVGMHVSVCFLTEVQTVTSVA